MLPPIKEEILETEGMDMDKVTSDGRRLWVAFNGISDPYILVSTTKAFDGTFTWHSLGRYGKKRFDTSEAALRAAAKSLGIKVVK